MFVVEFSIIDSISGFFRAKGDSALNLDLFSLSRGRWGWGWGCQMDTEANKQTNRKKDKLKAKPQRVETSSSSSSTVPHRAAQPQTGTMRTPLPMIHVDSDTGNHMDALKPVTIMT